MGLAHCSCSINICLKNRWISTTPWLELLFIFQIWNYKFQKACCLGGHMWAPPSPQTPWECWIEFVLETASLSKVKLAKRYKSSVPVRFLKQWLRLLLQYEKAWRGTRLKPPTHSLLPSITCTCPRPSPDRTAIPVLTPCETWQWKQKAGQERTPSIIGGPSAATSHSIVNNYWPVCPPTTQRSNYGLLFCVPSTKHSAWREAEDGRAGGNMQAAGKETAVLVVPQPIPSLPSGAKDTPSEGCTPPLN